MSFRYNIYRKLGWKPIRVSKWEDGDFNTPARKFTYARVLE